MSSIRSSVKRKIQPKEDIMQQSYSEVIYTDVTFLSVSLSDLHCMRMWKWFLFSCGKQNEIGFVRTLVSILPALVLGISTPSDKFEVFNTSNRQNCSKSISIVRWHRRYSNSEYRSWYRDFCKNKKQHGIIASDHIYTYLYIYIILNINIPCRSACDLSSVEKKFLYVYHCMFICVFIYLYYSCRVRLTDCWKLMFVVFEFQLDGSSNNKFMNGYTQNRSERNTGTALPDIVGEQSFKSRTNK